METYWGKSHIECDHLYQQCEDYIKTSGATGINRISFVVIFLRGSISIKWTQHKRRYKSVTYIKWFDFKAFLQKNFRSSQSFIDSIWSKPRKNS